jgi:hypothetical protein
MPKSRRWRGLELQLLSLAVLINCSKSAAPPHAPVALRSTAAHSDIDRDKPANRISAEAHDPKQSPALADRPAPNAILTAAEAKQSCPAGATSAAGAEASVEGALPTLPKGTFVLQIGDSFADALGTELSKRFKAAGVRSALEYKNASYIPNWSFAGDIARFIAHYRPDLVLITLGANEIEIPKPEQRAHAIQHLVAELGGRPCVWIAPPLWKPDTGLMQVIRDHVSPCRYLDSSALVPDLPRARDKIHPSKEGSRIWADRVFTWLSNERAGSPERPWALKSEAKASGCSVALPGS